MDLSRLVSRYQMLATAQTADPQRIHYMQIINLNKQANDLYNIIAKSAYTDQIKTYVKNISQMASALATKAYNNGITKDESTSAHSNINGVANTLKTLIHENTLLPFDNLLKALNPWTPVDLAIQNPNAPKPQTTNPTNLQTGTPTPITTPTQIAPQNPGGIAGI